MKKIASYMHIIIVVIIFALLIGWLVVLSDKSKEATIGSNKNAVKEQIGKTIRLCYSIEGIYPPSIEYLKDNYGLIIDDQYFVHYEIFADNIMPQYEVYDMEEKDATN